MRYAGWREHEDAVDSRDDRAIERDMGAPLHTGWAYKRNTEPSPPAVPRPAETAVPKKKSSTEKPV